MADFTEHNFYTFISERHQTYLRRAHGGEAPWTRDPVIAGYHFCNIFRELDRGTQWFKAHMTPGTGEDVVFRTVFYRLVNMVWWFEEVSKRMNLKPGIPGYATWDARRVQLFEAAEGLSLYNPAHRILQGTDGQDRYTSLKGSVNWLGENIVELTVNLKAATPSLKDGIAAVSAVPKVGGFIGLQIIRDLVLMGWFFDETKWCYIGPGAQATLKELRSEQDPLGESYQDQMKRLTEQQKAAYPSLHISPPLLAQQLPNLCDIEHSLCEFGKYVKYSRGAGTKRKYISGGGPVRFAVPREKW